MKHWTPEAQSDSIEFSTCKTPVIMLQWQGMDGTKGRMISLLTNHFNVERATTNDHFSMNSVSATLDTPTTGVTVKSTDASVHKSIPGLPKVPQSNAVPPTSGSSGTTVPATPVKGSADASDAFSF
ncbi:hypothetical protein Tco_0713078 [Tanacetum coccineum]